MVESTAATQIRFRDLVRLTDAGVLPGGRFVAAAALVRDGAQWRRIGRLMWLAVGAGHLLAGIAFFFAYNWNDLPPLLRLALPQLLLAGSGGGALALGLDRTVGKALLFVAATSIAICIAVVAQTYGVAGETWVFAALWSGLVLPFAIAGQSGAIWLLLAAALGWAIWDGANVRLGLEGRFIPAVATAPFLGLLLLRETARRRRAAFARPRWLRLAPFAVIAAGLAVSGIAALIGDERGLDAWAWTGLCLLGIAALGLLASRWRDAGAFGIAVGLGALLVGYAGGERISGLLDGDFADSILHWAIWTAWTVGLTAGAARLALSAQRRFGSPS